MKKKNRNAIPDFSAKRKGPPPPGITDTAKQQQPAQNPNVRPIKPPATSMKSGRRGS